MESTQALAAFGALSQETRLAALRLLIAAGPQGLAAGQLATQLAVPANTLSAHLNTLSQAGLVTSHRDGRRVIYTARTETMAALIAYLTRDCCGGAPNLCFTAPSGTDQP